MQYHKQMGTVATVAMHKRQVKIDLGVIHLDGGNRIKAYTEKPEYDYNVSMGVYVFEPRILEHIPSGEYYDFPTLVQRLLDNEDPISGYPFSGYWLDIGRPDDYQQAVIDFENMRSVFLWEQEDEMANSPGRS